MNKDDFYDSTRSATEGIPKHDVVTLMLVDFIATVGSSKESQELVS